MLKIISLIFLLISGLSFGESTKEKPNILFISVDDLNDWVGAMGGHPQAQTPNLDRLFKQGVLFTNAHCSQAVCTASRNSVLSGLHPTTSGWYQSTTAMKKSYPEVMGKHPMLPEYFKRQGYYTMAMGKVFHSGVTDYKEKEDDFWSETGFRYKVPKDLRERGDGYKGTHFYPFPKGGSQISRHYGKEYRDGNSLCGGPLDREDIPDGEMYDEKIAKWAVRRLKKDYDEPFFMAVGFLRPHLPFTAPREYFDLYDASTLKMPKLPATEMTDIPLMGKAIAHGRIKGGDHQAVVNLSETYWREMVHAYLACISFVDAQIGLIIDSLEKSPHAKNTIIVLWSDHGHHLGEKAHWRKQSLWEEATKVPLFIKAPGLTQPLQKRHQVVSLLDIYPTLLDLLGHEKLEKLDGESLLPIIKDEKATRSRPVLNSWYYGNHAVRSQNWRYILYRDGTQELYDHRKDANEHTNLADSKEHRAIIAEHLKQIPKQPALPAGDEKWEGDKLDARIEQWKKEGVPEWLK